MGEFEVQPLEPTTWAGFAAMVERHNGVFGGCWCTWFHTMSSEKERTYEATGASSSVWWTRAGPTRGSCTTATRPSRGASTGARPSCRTSTTASSTTPRTMSCRTTASPASSWTSATGDGGCRPWRCRAPSTRSRRPVGARRGLPARHRREAQVRALRRHPHPVRAGGLCVRPQQGRRQLRHAPHRAVTAVPRSRTAPVTRWSGTSVQPVTTGGNR